MNRLLVVGLVGIAFLTAVGLGAVALLDRSAPAAAAPAPVPAPVAPPPATEPPPRPLPPLPPLPPRPSPVAAAPAPAAPAPPSPEPAPPPTTDPAKRLLGFGPLRRAIQAGLEEAAEGVRACRLPDAAITLTLETLEGRVRVAAVAVRPATGAATAEATGVTPAPLDENGVRCVTSALEGRTFDAQIARPGRRWEMPWTPGAPP